MLSDMKVSAAKPRAKEYLRKHRDGTQAKLLTV